VQLRQKATAVKEWLKYSGTWPEFHQQPTNHPFYGHYTGQPALDGTSS